MNGVTIVAISEDQGKELLRLQQEQTNLLREILQRVKRIPGRAESLDVILGKPIDQT